MFICINLNLKSEYFDRRSPQVDGICWFEEATESHGQASASESGETSSHVQSLDSGQIPETKMTDTQHSLMPFPSSFVCVGMPT